MSLVVVETFADEPLYPDRPSDTDYRVLDCLAERGSTWRYSLLSSDRLRMICTFDAPDAEAVRESYRRGGGTFNRVWAGELVVPQDGAARQVDRLYVVESVFPEGLTDGDWQEMSRRMLPCLVERGMELVQSYLSRDRQRLICELNAPDAEVIREAHRKVGIPFERVWGGMAIEP